MVDSQRLLIHLCVVFTCTWLMYIKANFAVLIFMPMFINPKRYMFEWQLSLEKIDVAVT